MVACFLLSSAQTRLCQTPGRRRPLITGRFVNTAVRGPALGDIPIRAVVVCFPLLLCADWRQHTDCAVPSLMLKPRNTPYPLPGLGRKGASLPYMANEIVVATLFMVPRWRPHQFFPLLLCAGCRWIPLVFVSNLPFGLLQYIVQNSTKCRLGRNSWRHSVHPYGGTRCVHPVCFI